jgi:hypothetical protein
VDIKAGKSSSEPASAALFSSECVLHRRLEFRVGRSHLGMPLAFFHLLDDLGLGALVTLVFRRDILEGRADLFFFSAS